MPENPEWQEYRLTRRVRRVIFYCFLTAFLITVTIVLSYGSGYRFNPALWLFRQTGTISINIEPTDARVFLNNEPVKKTLPMRLQNLLPGNYEVRLERDGFYSWQKNLPVYKKETTFVARFRLFPNANPILIFAVPDAGVGALNVRNDFVYRVRAAGMDEWFVRDFITGRSVRLTRRPLQDATAVWSASGNYGVILFTNDRPLFFTSTGDTFLPTVDVKNVRFDATSDSVSAITKKGAAVRFLLPSMEPVALGPADDTMTDGERIYRLSNGANDSAITLSRLPNPAEEPIKIKKGAYRLAALFGETIILADQTNERLLIVFPNQEQLKSAGTNIVAESKNNPRFAVSFGLHEIWLIDLAERQSTLLTRVAEDIKNVSFIPGTESVLVQYIARLEIININDHEPKTKIDRVSGEEIFDALVDKKGQRATLAGQINGVNGVFTFPLQ